MPTFESSQSFPRPLAEVFEFFSVPANLTKVSPPDLHMKLVDGPDRLAQGARFTIHGRRWGIPQTIVSEVTRFDPPREFTDVQVKGPFGRWEHTHRFEEVNGGCTVHDRIDFEPPRGLVGLVLNAAAIEKDLHWVFEFRRAKLEELFGKMPG